MKSIGVAVVSSALLACGGAMAQQGFYLGGGVGQSMTDFNSEFAGSGHTPNAYSEDKTKNAYKLFAGYGFNKYFAIEGGYAELGKPSATNTWTGGTATSAQTEHSWFAAAKGTLPINEQFNVFAKLGVTSNYVKYSFSETPSGDTESKTNTRTDVLLGLGAEYKLTQQVGIRLEYEDFGKFGSEFGNDPRNPGTGRTRTSMWSLGATYSF